MALATVSGFLKDLGLVSLGNRSPELVFEIDDLVTLGSGTLIPQEPISVIPASDGSFTVSLNPSADTNPFAPYKLTVNWQSKGINRSITPSWRIFVPAGGGNIADMVSVVFPTKIVTKGDKGDSGNVTQQAAIDALTAKNTEQDGRLTTNEVKNTTQDGRLTTLETAGYVPAWKTATAYVAGQKVVSPGGDVVTAIANHTSTTYVPANWTASTQDGRIGAAEAKNTTQDGRLDTVEAKQAVKCVRLESGAWVWDKTTGTHYVIPDSDGSLIVRPTAQPVPASTPVLNW